jgi:multiple sugar transport system permease protein
MATTTDIHTYRSSNVRLGNNIRRALLYAFTIALSLGFVFPFFWSLSSSLKTPVELIDYPPRLFPRVANWSSYYEAFTVIPFGRFLTNTVIITALSLVGQVVTGLLVAYGFARFTFPLKGAIFALCLSTMILPVQVTIIPLFVIFRNLHWINTWKPLIVPSYFGGGAFTIFLLRQFIMTLPIDLDEAALIDGSGRLGILLRIILPNAGPVLATVAVFSFMGNWNSFLGPLIFLNDPEKFPISLGLWYLMNTAGTPGLPRDNVLMAGSVMATLPIVILFFFTQRYFVSGIAMSGIKG